MIENTASQEVGCQAAMVSAPVEGGWASEANAWLAAVVDNSDDAIVTKTLDGVITTWNPGAERLFGYAQDEAVGRPITMLIPEDRLSEEDDILRRVRAGDRVDHFETVRRRKNGELVEISVTVSPVRDRNGAILGASKIARDITEQKRAVARQEILLREMNHRVSNLFSLMGGLVTLSAKSAISVTDLAEDLRSRIHALSRAHKLTTPDVSGLTGVDRPTDVATLLKAIIEPYVKNECSHRIISLSDTDIAGKALMSMALLLNELATNSVKYGALSGSGGNLTVELQSTGESLLMLWLESKVPSPPKHVEREGFGSVLQLATVSDLGGHLERRFTADGVIIKLEVPLQGRAG
ncbi:sensor histidine kinase [Mangrovibrevibacter kandeliae]|uniref:sensor histidine kinase n=1 Tax=Mangrovibrevibacter kandeliae TaxID=2968473 RepID=UPI00211731BC|nr:MULTISPECIES: PAS domain S-box protein [unclassified Aurantimonas]MCQ8781581.1 PAS domain S-box protein [Aurantimonas sp. CSK15Z-1]MCW4114355.1 PAS domain S-box protein [Aurantimonas sp. MSK8Z-1]